MQKVLITGIDSFTGVHLSSYLKKLGYILYGTSLFKSDKNKYKCDITKKDDILDVLQKVKPDFLIHLSGISFAAHDNNEEFYRVNTIGTLNILDCIVELNLSLKKVIIASSATVYGNQGVSILDESLPATPANHYGASKYAMECLAKGYFLKIPIIITRPFNYTGIGQAEHFLIPKIVKHFQEKKEIVELGNIEVSREFNDVNFVCEVYEKLLLCEAKGEVVNIASNKGIKLLDVITMMNEIAHYDIKVVVNSAFVRKDDIKKLTGSNTKLISLIGETDSKPLQDTLQEMFEHKKLL